LAEKDLQQEAAAEISISPDGWEDFQKAYPIGLVQAILWLALSTLSQMGIHKLIEDGHLVLPEWSPKFGGQVAIMLIFSTVLFIYWKFVRKAKLRTLGLRLDRLGGDLNFALVAAVGMGLFYLVVAGIYWLVLQVGFENGGEMFKQHLRGAIFKEDTVLYFVGVVVFFPILEEIWFRGLLYTPMRREWGRWPSIVILSLLFAFAHNNPVPINQFFGGLIFAYAYEKRRSLVAPIILHMLGNGALAVLGWALLKWQLV
jgi:membrane protease YdiL (CAAX protease family)